MLSQNSPGMQYIIYKQVYNLYTFFVVDCPDRKTEKKKCYQRVVMSTTRFHRRDVDLVSFSVGINFS